VYELATNRNNSESYVETKKALLKNIDNTEEFYIYSSTVNQILETFI